MTAAQPQVGQYGVLLLARRKWRTEFVISLVSWATRSPAYHAVVVVAHPTGPDTVEIAIVEAEPGGAVISPLNKYTNVMWSSVPETKAQASAISDAALSMVGRAYGWYDDALLGVTRITRRRGPAILWRFLSRPTGPLECAQLVDAAFLAAGVHLFTDGRQTGDVTPGDLYGLILGKAVTGVWR